MCGLVGMIDYSASKFFMQAKDEFFTMLLLNSLRGKDSTGVMGVRKKEKTVEFIKSVGDPWELWKYKDYDIFANRIVSDYTAILGHGRFSTRGAVNAKNAHPHKRGHISLIHNGTISNFDELKKEYNQKFEVDSDLCANMIADKGIHATAKLLRGAFAFIWYDEKTEKMHVLRNYERPLFLFHREEKCQFLFASDDAIFDYLKAKYTFIGESKTFEAGYLYTFGMDSKEYTKEQIDFAPVQYYGGTQHDYTAAAVRQWMGYDNDDFEGTPLNNATILRPPFPKSSTISTIFEAPKANKNFSTTNYAQAGVKWKLGDRVNFALETWNERTIPKSGEIVYVLHGVLAESQPTTIEVTSTFNGSVLEIIDRGLLTGILKSIIVLDDDLKFTARFMVTEVKPLEMDIPDMDGLEHIDPTEDTEIVDQPLVDEKQWCTLRDDSRVPLHRFQELSKLDCYYCSATVVPLQAKSCLIIDNKLYCPDCVEKGEFPKNG